MASAGEQRKRSPEPLSEEDAGRAQLRGALAALGSAGRLTGRSGTISPVTPNTRPASYPPSASPAEFTQKSNKYSRYNEAETEVQTIWNTYSNNQFCGCLRLYWYSQTLVLQGSSREKAAADDR